MPAVSEKQRKFFLSEYLRRKEGKKPRLKISDEVLKEFLRVKKQKKHKKHK
jgi:hypothetical protein